MNRQAIHQVARNLRQDSWKLSPEDAIQLYRQTNDNEGFLVTFFPSQQEPIVKFIKFTPQELEEVISCASL
jgi:hypothetical protein